MASVMATVPLCNGPCWFGCPQKPAHNEYYAQSFISIYGETIEYGSTIAVTEKTYDPLIKGHFILPFSTVGFVDYLKGIGFRFPEFIDYHYDTVADDDTRFGHYTQEVCRLLTLDLDTWRQHWNDNIDIIEHNKKLFHLRPYDQIDFSKYR